MNDIHRSMNVYVCVCGNTSNGTESQSLRVETANLDMLCEECECGSACMSPQSSYNHLLPGGTEEIISITLI